MLGHGVNCADLVFDIRIDYLQVIAFYGRKEFRIMIEEIMTFLVLGLIVCVVFGVACSELAKQRKAGYKGSWFIVGLCLGPLGLGLVLLSQKQEE